MHSHSPLLSLLLSLPHNYTLGHWLCNWGDLLECKSQPRRFCQTFRTTWIQGSWKLIHIYIYIHVYIYIYIWWYFPDSKPIPIFIYVLNFRCKNYSGFTTSILVHSSDPAFVHSVKNWLNIYVVQTVLMQVPTLIKLQFCYTVFMFTHPINAAYPLQLQSFA